ncbi:MAG: hypothetical protein EOM22_19615, partial [Gammaproteobacteria bacterium]|nr:hypothetical protein [Gammaproteobacteria bacterium]
MNTKLASWGEHLLRALGRTLGPLAVPLSAASMALVAAALVIPQLLSELPPMHDISEITLEEPLRIYAADGSLMAQFGVERRQPVTFQ